MTKGWKLESARHALARRGIETGRKTVPIKTSAIRAHTKYVSDEGFEFKFQPIEDSLIVEQTKDGYIAKYLIQDEEPTSPDEWDEDDSLFLVHYHRDFDIRKDKIITEDDARALYQGEKIPQEKDYWIFPIAAYIHGGVSLSLAGGFHGRLPQGHEEFDVSNVGLILASKKEFKSKEKAQKSAESLIEAWDIYLRGEVYSIVKETYDKNKKPIDYEIRGGNYGYKSSLEELKTYEG